MSVGTTAGSPAGDAEAGDAEAGDGEAGDGEAGDGEAGDGELTDRAGQAGPRRGLVLGAGGVLGFAWMVGALRALQDAAGLDVRDMEVCVGTSAGSILAALLGLGVGVDEILRHQQGVPLPTDPRIDWDYGTDGGGPLPPLPWPGLGSPDLLLRVARHPRGVSPLAAMSALLPRGRASLRSVGQMIDFVAATDRPGRGGPPIGLARSGAPSTSGWPARPRPWIVAMDYDGGRRVAFGRPDVAPGRLSDAVMASCAIPGWYAPVRIDGRRYVDGGTCSPTSLDLLAGVGLDEVWALAPMASFALDRPRTPMVRLERRVRRTVTRRMLAEAARLRESGTAVTMLGPGPEDLRAMGANLMNPRRRADVLTTSLRTSSAALGRADRSTGAAILPAAR